MLKVLNPNYDALRAALAEIKDKVRNSQLNALRSVNKELISLYWDIGRIIVEKQDQHGWGKSIVEDLAAELQNEFPGMKGFSSSNLWRIRNFYLTYHKSRKLAQLVREIGWSHNLGCVNNILAMTPHCVILGKKCSVFQRKTLAFLDRGSLRPQDPRAKKH